ncbi:hypothetical protein LTR86_008324 [Recurvomyces mirabilis]|nr:hypothetical protein LTR86_008324 [Recurvomyces mirabilis]
MAPSQQRETPGRVRIVLGVDYGTTYSGVSYGTTDKTNAADVTVIRSWPGRDGEWKVPSRIAYERENNTFGLTQNAWGYDVQPSMVSYSWTKLLLDQSTGPPHDDPDFRLALDQGMLRLPSNYTAQRVCGDFLREVYNYSTAQLIKQISKEVFDSTPVDCWLTVPAVWSDQARDSTRTAAYAAGFGCRPQDTINIISEPEAGAIAALHKYTHPSSLNKPQVGESIMICDCGGGTVDITTYMITDTTPRLEFREVCVGIGAKCGATYVDRNLHKLMRQRFGQAFNEVDMKRKGPGSRFMNSWESVKRGFGSAGDSRVQEIGPLVMKGVNSSQYYDEDDSLVRLTRWATPVRIMWKAKSLIMALGRTSKASSRPSSTKF